MHRILGKRVTRIVFLVSVGLFVTAVHSSVKGFRTPNLVTPGTLQAAASSRPFVIRHARIFDGKRVIAADSVFVQNAKIQSVGKRIKVPSGTEEIDATGDTLLPGLIDSHTHDWGDSPKQALLFGVTTELNMACIPKYVAKIKQAEAEGKALDAADVLSAGNVVTPPKGHGTEFGVPVPTLASSAEAQQFVDERIAEGSDYIKIIYEDGHVCHSPFSKFSREELAASVAAAHKRGKMAIVHISTQEDARDAIAAGADGIAHLFADSAPQSDFAELVRRHHAFVETTLTAIQSSFGTPSGASLSIDHRIAEFLSAGAESNLKALMPFKCSGELENALAAAKQLHDAGVPVLAGTDAPAPGSWNGASLHGELELLVRAGLSPLDALAATTSLPASTFICPTVAASRLASGPISCLSGVTRPMTLSPQGTSLPSGSSGLKLTG
ncbi:MAG TPA: amidohydrolase family protein [Candidatus Dormibacteraeota bacterium]|nr:amidohydrolase family protein [Candidatus Dormibacteraeota bacterium]